MRKVKATLIRRQHPEGLVADVGRLMRSNNGFSEGEGEEEESVEVCAN